MAKGQHIFVRRPGRWFVRGMLHHGIDLGDGTVVHFTGEDSKSARILRTNIKIFENYGEIKPFPYDRIYEFASREFGDEVRKAIARNYNELGEHVPPPSVVPLLPDDVVIRALHWLGTSFLESKYDCATNNCEHFATACATGFPFSLQVQYEREFLFRRPSFGASLSSILIEVARFKFNPWPKPKDGWYFIGATYEDREKGIQYKETYSEPEGESPKLPPKWEKESDSKSTFQIVDQKMVPYPLKGLTRHYCNDNKQLKEEPINS